MGPKTEPWGTLDNIWNKSNSNNVECVTDYQTKSPIQKQVRNYLNKRFTINTTRFQFMY